MRYVVIEYFEDLKDDRFKYHPGDEYPRSGLNPSKKRINELLSDRNKRKRPVIVIAEEE